MEQLGRAHSPYGLEQQGIRNVGNVWWNLTTPVLYEEAVRRREVVITHLGPLAVRTGQYTGRSPQDKFIVREPSSEDRIWWGTNNRGLEPAQFEILRNRLLAYLQGKDLFVQDCFVGADREYRVPIRVITETAWHNLFARNMFIHASTEELARHVPDFTIIHAPHFHAVPELDGTNSEAFIVVNFGHGLVLVGGTSYAGEIKKSVFTVMNYILPQKQVLPMHCSANAGPGGDVALFFGLSGTGKTTLSAVADRSLIGDDEHGWSDRGVFTFEGGCYAKIIRLSRDAEPEIFQAVRRFGAILENVAVDTVTHLADLDDASLTENTRACYPVSFMPNATSSGTAGHPTNIIMLTADAFGVMPPIARLTAAQATYHFLSGYTAKVAGTERGVVEPQAIFSACFGAPFMALHPNVYAELLRDKVARHKVDVWLINTGWSGGPYGVGQRIAIAHTRAMVRAALSGALADVPSEEDPIFGIQVPTACPNVPAEVLKTRATWPDAAAYDAQARKLAGMFAKNFKQFAGQVSAEVGRAGPRVG